MNIPQTPRHDFLRSLHELLRPATYLEIGVQTGRSLAQAIPPTECVGVDPAPQISVPIAAPYSIVNRTSDEFFTGETAETFAPYDLAFIDGMHLVEYCLRDFIGVERLARPDGRTVAVFDDVLPYSHTIAMREQPPGNWAGDCWKVTQILEQRRPDLLCVLVNVAPTGALVVLDLDPANTTLAAEYANIEQVYAREFDSSSTAASIALEHRHAVGPAAALKIIRNHLNITEA